MSVISTIKTITTICDKYKALSKATGENYNIFRVINRTSQEVGVHSAFISNLLNPQEEHGYSTTFLNLFIKQLKIDGFDLESAKVKVEKYIGVKTETTGGQLDIDIWDKNNFHIIIENKIYARDQENQMLRYYNYGKQRKDFRLFYLTLGGAMPDEEYSCQGLEVGDDYYLLSYAFDIKKWLEGCREKAANNPLLREGISHYINLIKYLTNQTMSDALKEELAEALMNKETILNLSNVEETILLVKHKIQLNFWNGLKSKFEEKSKDEFYLVNGDDFECGNENLYKFNLSVCKNEQFKVTYHFESHGDIFCGFEICAGGDNQVNLKEEYAAYRDIVKEINSEYESSEGWLGCKKLQPILNFQNINDETCKCLANLDETVDIMFENIDSEIKEFKRRFNELQTNLDSK